MIGYLHVHEDADLSMGIFRLQRGACLPLHNHPGMTVLSRHVARCLTNSLTDASSRDGSHDERGWCFRQALFEQACLPFFLLRARVRDQHWHAQIACCYNKSSLYT